MSKQSNTLEIIILRMHILVMPFISAFSISPWLPLPLVLMALVTIFALLTARLKFTKEDVEIFLVIVLGIIAMMFSTDYLGAKNLNHTAAILTSVVFFFITVKSLLRKVKSLEVFGEAFAVSLAIVSAFVVVEFIGSNFFGIKFVDVIPYGQIDLSDASVAGYFIRPRGFAEEAGHMAVFYELALPLSFLYFKDKPFIIQASYYLPVLGTFILLVSATAFVALPVALMIVSLSNIRSKSSLVIVIVVSLLVVIALSSDLSRSYLDQTVGARLQIFSDPSEQSNFSAFDRARRFRDALSLFVSAPFGIGWGTVSQMAVDSQIFAGIQVVDAGLISLYAEVLIASGLIGLALFLKFIVARIIGLSKIRSLESRLVLVAVLSLSIHYTFISNYWFPMIWFALAAADVIIQKDKCRTFRIDN
ncbi:O-antigen ligase family protein [Phormidesmis priestleyi]|uniref:O-antigen ligase family protein n=1 Tax=Phormidesmis priestleyi TaxID=268141 RepID=UPI00083B8BE1|nr:O-antigen ligase family protein [Phormidesmis priestleyi]